jgi:hypothetical protein
MLGSESRQSRIVRGSAWLAAILILAAGCGNPVRSKVESRIESALPRLIGPAKSYSVSVSGSTVGMLKGRLRSAHIIGRDIQFPSGITVSELEVLSHGIEIDRHRQQISSVLDTSYSATLGQDALNKYLCDTYRQVPHLKTELRKDQLHVSASPEVAGVQVHISADAALKVRDNRYLILDLTNVSVVGVSTPGFAREYLESRINPVFDSASFGYDAKVDRVSIMPGGLRIEGTLDLAKQLNVESRLPSSLLHPYTLSSRAYRRVAQLSTSPS